MVSEADSVFVIFDNWIKKSANESNFVNELK